MIKITLEAYLEPAEEWTGKYASALLSHLLSDHLLSVSADSFQKLPLIAHWRDDRKTVGHAKLIVKAFAPRA